MQSAQNTKIDLFSPRALALEMSPSICLMSFVVEKQKPGLNVHATKIIPGLLDGMKEHYRTKGYLFVHPSIIQSQIMHLLFWFFCCHSRLPIFS